MEQCAGPLGFLPGTNRSAVGPTRTKQPNLSLTVVDQTQADCSSYDSAAADVVVAVVAVVVVVVVVVAAAAADVVVVLGPLGPSTWHQVH
jgi:hypothetical protein